MILSPHTALLLFAACLYLWAPNLSAQSPATTESAIQATEPEVTRPEKSDPAALKIVKNYQVASGGLDTHASLRSLSIKGSITEAGETKNFELIETREGQRLITYRWKKLGRHYVETIASDGTDVWEQRTKPEKDFARTMKGPRATHFSHQYWFLQPALNPGENGFIYQLQGSAKILGRPCYIVLAWAPNNEKTWLYIDKETFLLLRWGGLGQVASATEYIDYRSTRFRPIHGVLMPSSIDLVFENDAFGTISIDSIEANIEANFSIFKMPVENSPVLRQQKSTADQASP